jgi:L-rhamnose-H+ transport protein
MKQHQTASRFQRQGTGHYWGLAAVMAVCWFGSTVLYGVAAVQLGALGAILGWPLYMSLIVITASLLGVAAGEWKHAGKRPLQLMLGSVGVLVAAIFVLSLASRWT